MEIYQSSLYYEFGPYRLDPNRRVLTKAGETISLTPKATDILLTLIQNAGQLVEKDELLKEVWPDTFVEESNLTQNIFTLRRALGDERGGPKYIETVTRRGYRFAAPVRIIRSNENQVITTESAELSARGLVIAVMPFLNATGNHELEYLADGLTDNLINSLSRAPKLRVISRSAVFRYKTNDVDPHQVATGLGANVVLLGKINSQPNGIAISVELVDVTTNWQLWGDSFDADAKDILEIPERISRQVLATFNLSAADNDGTCVASRYTENSKAYDAYLEGRYHWSQYTRTGIETAIGHFRRAIELDPNYALAYAGIVDCYLRLATNYLPPEDAGSKIEKEIVYPSEIQSHQLNGSKCHVKLRFEWDWKGAERELRRANELNADYPGTHQWYAAYRFCVGLLRESLHDTKTSIDIIRTQEIRLRQFFSSTLGPNEEIQVFCAVTREQMEGGNYDAGLLLLRKWWTPGNWPNLEGLNSRAAADLLFTTGALVSCLSSTGRIQKGQKHAEDLLSGSIGIFEHIGAKRRSAESRIELALSYYRQGMFDLSRKTLLGVLEALHPSDHDLRSLSLIRLGVVERHAGHANDSLARLSEAQVIIEVDGPLVAGRYYHELATTLQEIAKTEINSNMENVIQHFQRAFFEFVAIGHHRYAAVVENNLGLLLLTLEYFKDAEIHLVNARRFFEVFDDKIRGAQVDDTLAQLYIKTGRLVLADSSSQRAVSCLEVNDEEALLAEALTTRGIVVCKLGRRSEARGILEGACRIAERCGDSEGAGRALLTILEQMYDDLGLDESRDIVMRVQELLEHTQVVSTSFRLKNCLNLLSKFS